MLQAAETGVVAEYPEIHETFNPRVLAATSGWVNRMSSGGKQLNGLRRALERQSYVMGFGVDDHAFHDRGQLG